MFLECHRFFALVRPFQRQLQRSAALAVRCLIAKFPDPAKRDTVRRHKFALLHFQLRPDDLARPEIGKIEGGRQDGLAVRAENDAALFADVGLPAAIFTFPRSLQHGPEDGIVHIGVVAVQQERGIRIFHAVAPVHDPVCDKVLI